MATDGVHENVKDAPPFTGVMGTLARFVEVTLKSEATPVVAPNASLVVIVHVMTPPRRNGDAAEQTSVDDVVGELTTAIVNVPPTIVLPPACALTVNAEYADPGTVEKVNVDPPVMVKGIMEGLLLDETEKSDAIPVDGPNGEDDDTVIVHKIGDEARWGLLELHARVDSELGIPNTGST